LTTAVVIKSGHKVFIALALIMAFHARLSAQVDNSRSKKWVVQSDSLQVDTLSLISGSVKVLCNGLNLDPASYKVDEIKSLIHFTQKPDCDTIEISYRILPVFLGKSYYHKSPDLLTKESATQLKPYVIGSYKPNSNPFSQDGIQKNGSISRGISFGNSQNLTVNSALNLQLTGNITERYKILASVTDDNIPIQPSGNTQQLQDFDQVFIQVYDDHTKMIAGDFLLKKPVGYFLNYFKRAQGAYFSSRILDNSKTTFHLDVEASVSISKGRFGRNIIQGIEGNQGPYRLSGADNELFIIILAGTEQVYIDGRLLQRGQDKDYVIDYNAAEITFTPRQFITKDRRINVEFQYSEKRYARPLVQSSITAEHHQNKYYINIYSESDAKNQSLQQDLTDEEKLILSRSGDNLLFAYSTGIESVSFSNSLVLYSMVDSLGFDSVFVFSTDSSQSVYRINFSSVGAGNGDYVEDGFTSNGKKYKWVAPIDQNGVFIHQGNYAPIRLLATPKKNQMITAGAEFIFGGHKSGVIRKSKSSLMVEGALSHKDLNTFSPINSNDDNGIALKSKFKWQSPPRQSETAVDSILGNPKNIYAFELGYEHTNKNFAQIERFREVEFARNWNLPQINTAADQHIAGTTFSVRRPKLGLIQAGSDLFIGGSGYSGHKTKLLTQINTPGKFKADITGSYLITRGQIESSFLRHRSTLSKEYKFLRVYFRDEHENNQYKTAQADSLAPNSYQFFDWEGGIGTADTTSKSVTAYYRSRDDYRVVNSNLGKTAHADQYGMLVTYRGKKESRLNINLSKRVLKVIQVSDQPIQPENNLLTRVDYNFKLKDGFLQSTTFYEIGSGYEQSREFVYVEVQPGQGAYIWNDYNSNGIKELSEFEIAQFSYEANYIRTSIQTNNYLRTYTNQFTQTLSINPQRILKQDKKWSAFVSRFSNNTSIRTDRKTSREESKDRFNPFLTDVADSTLLSINSLFRNIFFFNKSNPAFGFDYTFQNSQNKNLLTNGFESRTSEFHQIGVRWNFISEYTFFTEVRQEKKGASSDFLSGRNYSISQLSIQPKFTWQPSTSARLNLTGQYQNKENKSGIEKATILKFGLDATLNTIEKGSFLAEINFYKISFTGSTNNSLSFEMLEGLQAGNNFTWSATLQRTIAKNIQVNLIYNGRKPESTKTIHSGGIQIRAFF
jgi:hypothetical protein